MHRNVTQTCKFNNIGVLTVWYETIYHQLINLDWTRLDLQFCTQFCRC